MILRLRISPCHRLRFPSSGFAALVGWALVVLLVGFDETNPEAISEVSSTSLPVTFFREDITLSVDDSTVTVRGVYWFRNRLRRDFEHSFLYPFPVDECLDDPDAVNLWTGEEEELEPLSFQPRPERHAVLVRLRLPAEGVVRWVARYRQRMHCPRARYILRTTGAWGQPLERGDYRFELPDSLREVRSWPEADSTSVREGRRILQAQRRDFLPDRDMELWWSAQSPPDR